MDDRFVSIPANSNDPADTPDFIAGECERRLFEAAREYAGQFGFDEAIRIACEGATSARGERGERHDH